MPLSQRGSGFNYIRNISFVGFYPHYELKKCAEKCKEDPKVGQLKYFLSDISL